MRKKKIFKEKIKQTQEKIEGVLYYRQGMTVGEVAEALNIPTTKIDVIIIKAIVNFFLILFLNFNNSFIFISINSS